MGSPGTIDGTIDAAALQALIDKDAIRDLVLAYSRAIDRQDIDLLRDLYTDDASDSHGNSFDGPAAEYCDFIAGSAPHMPYSGHHVCNHMVSVAGDVGEGEVYALAYHLLPAGAVDAEAVEDPMAVRYIDNYRRCAEGRWRFAKRIVTYDLQVRRPFAGGGTLGRGDRDPSYEMCTQPMFRRGARA